MNWKQLFALLKLRFQLTKNQALKAGKFNYYVSMILMWVAIFASCMFFFVGIAAGLIWFNPETTTPGVILVSWTVVVGLFLFLWVCGLLAELQQTELLSIDKLLHLPISMHGAVLLNYTSCFYNMSFILVVPGMIGFTIGLIIGVGTQMLLALPLLIGFLFATSAFTYLVRDWLAKLIENKRNRGNLIAIITVLFVALSQVPNLLLQRGDKAEDRRRAEIRESFNEKYEAYSVFNDAQLIHGKINSQQLAFLNRLDTKQKKAELRTALRAEKQQKRKRLVKSLRSFNRYFPPGWVALGFAKLAEGSYIKPLLATLSFFVAGVFALGLSYRNAMARYTGTERRRKKSKKKVVSKEKTEQQLNFLYNKVPFASPHVSSVAFSSLKGLIRSPEAKMMMLFPIIIIFVLATVLVSTDKSLSDLSIPMSLRYWIPVGMFSGIMFSISGFNFNVFGMDRDGFRAYVLSPIKRTDLLLGKNLSLIPIAGGLCLAGAIVLQIFIPMGIFAFLGVILQIPAIYLCFSSLGNFFSIGFPMGIKRGTMQPANPKVMAMLALMLSMTFGMALLLVPSSIVIGATNLLEWAVGQPLGWVLLLLSAIQLAVTIWVYRIVLKQQANWLWTRESQILLEVANVPE